MILNVTAFSFKVISNEEVLKMLLRPNIVRKSGIPGIGTSIILKPSVDCGESDGIGSLDMVRTVTSCPARDQYFAQE
jgi:hypothetical protein